MTGKVKICSKEFTTKCSKTCLKQHLKIHNRNNECFQCDVCNIRFKNRGRLQRHAASIHGNGRTRSFHCEICGKAFNTGKHFFAHLRSHTGERPYKCDDCGKSYSIKYNLTNHLRVHTGERPFACDICQRTFTTKGRLRYHTKTHAADDTLLHGCPLCDKKFQEKSNMIQHIRTHDGLRPFKCSICPKSYKTNGSLQRHAGVHGEIRQFACPFCRWRSSYKHNLFDHIRRHIREAFHKCDECDKAFPRSIDLKKHRLAVHSPTTPFRCDICKQPFKSVDLLLVHRVKAHLTSFGCVFCGKSYGLRRKLFAQLRNSHIFEYS